jgi:hypothetical protein
VRSLQFRGATRRPVRQLPAPLPLMREKASGTDESIGVAVHLCTSWSAGASSHRDLAGETSCGEQIIRLYLARSRRLLRFKACSFRPMRPSLAYRGGPRLPTLKVRLKTRCCTACTLPSHIDVAQGMFTLAVTCSAMICATTSMRASFCPIVLVEFPE